MMKREFLFFCFFQLLCHSCFAQSTLRIDEHLSETDISYYTTVSEYVEKQTDLIALNSIIEVNGIVHSRHTYGYINYTNIDGINKRCYFLHWGGIINISKMDYDEILMLSDSSKVEIAICLQSPIIGKWGSCWDRVVVKGFFDVSQLITTRSTLLSPCFHFVITSIGVELFKIQFSSWKVQTCYYSIDSSQLTSRQRRRLDRKEQKIYDRAFLLDFNREMW